MSVISSFWKDIFREVSRSKARFISLALITALGAMTIVGIRATAINMRNIADRTYKEQALYDLHLRSTTGFTDDDIAAISNTQGVAEVMASYRFDAYVYVTGELRPVRTFSLPDTLNRITLIEGRLPEKYNEIAVERRFLDVNGYSIGDSIMLSLNDMEHFANIFATDEFTIVGTVSSPLFITFERGHTTLGNGRVRYYAYLHPDAYVPEVFTDVYIEMEGSREIFNLSHEYDDLAEEWAELLRVTGDARIEAFNADIYDARQRLEDARIELDEVRVELEDSQTELEEAKAELNAAMSQAENLPEGIRESALAEIEAGFAEIEANLAQIEAGWEEYYAGREELEAYFEALDSAPVPQWHYFTRRDGTAFDAYFQDTLRLQQLGYVFPVVFFLVAVLVALTSMSRMVEEHRGQMGVYKALGFGSRAVILKYGLYATLSGCFGGAAGVVIGSQMFPRVIASAYGSLYSMPPVETHIPWGISIVAILTSVLSVLVITIVTCVRTTSGMPAELLRPKAPKPGRRVLIERVSFIWKRLGFIEKVTARNIFRYKRRFFMTLLGVAGCTALIVTAFGMRDSLNRVAGLQFDEIILYDVVVYTQEIKYPEQRLELDALTHAELIMYSREETMTVLSSSGQIAATLVVPERADLLPYFIRLESMDGTLIDIPDRGVILTEKLARDLGISVGDMTQLRMGSGETYTVFVHGIVENYVFHFAYMSPEYYVEIFDATPYPNAILLKGEFDIHEILMIDEVRLVIEVTNRARGVSDSTDALDIVMIMILLLSCALSFIVLFNLTIINLEERRRELATIKVLGFQDRETAVYIFRENLAVTILGIIIGLVGGFYLTGFVITSIEIDVIKFPTQMRAASFVYAAVLSLAFALLVNVVTRRKLIRIDMVESLKSVE